jgi:hypothetical protein
MAKIGLFDHANGKTTKEIIKWFIEHGHEVKTAMYADPAIVKWSDVTLFEWIEHNLQSYTLSKDPPNEQWPDGDNAWIEARGMKKKIVARGMDIEVYAGHYRSVDWNEVTRLTYCANHIWELMNDGSVDWSKYPHLNPVRIPLSVDMKEWTYRKNRKKNGHNIAFMGDMWWAKAPEMMFQVLAALNAKSVTPYTAHIRGNWYGGTDAWMIKYRDNLVKELDLDIKYYDYVPNLDEWLDGMDYFVTTNLKDAFSLIVAQAAAKGIPTFPHNFWGATDIYPKEWVWSSIDQLVDKIVYSNHQKPEEYHQFIRDTYSNDKIMPLWEEILL